MPGIDLTEGKVVSPAVIKGGSGFLHDDTRLCDIYRDRGVLRMTDLLLVGMSYPFWKCGNVIVLDKNTRE